MSSNPYLPDPYVKHFVMADGTEMNGNIGETKINGDLWIWPSDSMTFAEAAVIFGDPNKTRAITMYYSDLETAQYDGYTKLDLIKEDSPGKMSIRMNKPRND